MFVPLQGFANERNWLKANICAFAVIHGVHNHPAFSQFGNNFKSYSFMIWALSAVCHQNINLFFPAVKFVTPEEEINRRIHYCESSKNILVVFDGDSYDVVNIFSW